jgi:polygalacturonase
MSSQAQSRREFIKVAGLAGVGLVVAPPVRPLRLVPWFNQAPAAAPEGVWEGTSWILARIKPPVFPSRTFDVGRYGAVGNGTTDCTMALNDAITVCSAAGGGRVVVPEGTFLTGAIRLRSHVDLHLGDGAVLKFSQDPARYLPLVFTRWEGTELMNYSPFVYAFEETDVAITGRGTLDGQAGPTAWWPWARKMQTPARNRLMDLASKGVPVAERVFGEGHYLRPSFIQPYRCKNVLIEGVTIVDSPMWELHPVLCTNVTVRDITIRSHGPNNDGCDPESCRDVLIERCSFDTGDDCVALKSGRNDDGRRVGVPIENVIIRDCEMKDGHGGVVIGSEISGDARNVFAERCRMDSPNLDRALRIKTNSQRGGLVERVYMRNVTVGQVAESLVTIDFFYQEGDTGSHTPVVRDIEIRDVTSRKSVYALLLRGYARAPIRDIRLVDCTFDNVAKDDVVESVKDLSLTNVTINGRVRNEQITRLVTSRS